LQSTSCVALIYLILPIKVVLVYAFLVSFFLKGFEVIVTIMRAYGIPPPQKIIFAVEGTFPAYEYPPRGRNPSGLCHPENLLSSFLDNTYLSASIVDNQCYSFRRKHSGSIFN
jgi:hypothetical protein